MRQILPGVMQWSRFMPEKGYEFNSYAFDDVLIDPVEIDVIRFAKISHIILTNADHERFAYKLREQFGAKIHAPALDASLLRETPDNTFSDSDTLPGGFVAVHITDGKTPGETLLYHKQRRLLVAGDAVIGWPKGELSLLPAMKYADPTQTKKALEKLLALDFTALLVGDGVCVLDHPKEALKRLLQRNDVHLRFPVA